MQLDKAQAKRQLDQVTLGADLVLGPLRALPWVQVLVEEPVQLDKRIGLELANQVIKPVVVGVVASVQVCAGNDALLVEATSLDVVGGFVRRTSKVLTLVELA